MGRDLETLWLPHRVTRPQPQPRARPSLMGKCKVSTWEEKVGSKWTPSGKGPIPDDFGGSRSRAGFILGKLAVTADPKYCFWTFLSHADQIHHTLQQKHLHSFSTFTELFFPHINGISSGNCTVWYLSSLLSPWQVKHQFFTHSSSVVATANQWWDTGDKTTIPDYCRFKEALIKMTYLDQGRNVIRDVIKPIETRVLARELGVPSAEHAHVVSAAFPCFHTWVVNANLHRKWKWETPIKDSTKI